jgi:thiol-disulfide isomerase/thioredoxin
MRSNRGTQIGRTALLALAVVALAASSAFAAPGKGSAAPELSGMDLAGGQERSLSEFKGKWVFVDFWASWCGPCMKELPKVVNLHNELSRNPNFTVLGVSLDEQNTLGDLRKAVQKNKVSYPVIYTGNGWNSLAASWGVSEIPTTFLIDPQGRVVDKDVPISQVKQLIEQGEGAAPREPSNAPPQLTVPADGRVARPVQVTCRERLLPISMSTGMDGGRDLEIVMGLQPSKPKLSKYRMYLRATKRLPDGSAREANWRYDINILLDPTNQRTPYFVEIRDASEPGKTAGFTPPELTAALDLQRNECQFIVPLAPDTLKLNYAVAYYDFDTGRYQAGQ